MKEIPTVELLAEPVVGDYPRCSDRQWARDTISLWSFSDQCMGINRREREQSNRWLNWLAWKDAAVQNRGK